MECLEAFEKIKEKLVWGLFLKHCDPKKDRSKQR